MAELADRVLLSRSGLTRLIDRLQTEGLVRREPSPDDARGTYTVLTPAGFDRLRRAAPVHLAGVREHWLRHFSDDELRVLAGLLGRDYVIPDDIKALAEPALAHRLIIKTSSSIHDIQPAQVIKELLESTTVGTVREPAVAGLSPADARRLDDELREFDR